MKTLTKPRGNVAIG